MCKSFLTLKDYSGGGQIELLSVELENEEMKLIDKGDEQI